MSWKAAVNSSFMLCVLALTAAPAFGQGVAFRASSLPQQTDTMGALVLKATNSGNITSGSSISVLYSGTLMNSPDNGSVSGSFNSGRTTCSGNCPNGGNGSTGTITVRLGGNQLTVVFNGAVRFLEGDYIVISQVHVKPVGSADSTVAATLSATSANPTTNPITIIQ